MRQSSRKTSSTQCAASMPRRTPTSRWEARPRRPESPRPTGPHHRRPPGAPHLTGPRHHRSSQVLPTGPTDTRHLALLHMRTPHRAQVSLTFECDGFHSFNHDGRDARGSGLPAPLEMRWEQALCHSVRSMLFIGFALYDCGFQ